MKTKLLFAALATLVCFATAQRALAELALQVLSEVQHPSSLLEGSDGNFYGTTAGGAANVGMVFKMTPAGALTNLASFNCTNGCAPSGLVEGSDGNFYGTTSDGGTNYGAGGAYGTVFRITPYGALTTLHSFNYTDGWDPRGSLVQGNDGNFYGTTFQGGAYEKGTIFQITTNGTLTTLLSFDGTNGSLPYASLAQGTDGNFYGTTKGGGTNYDGGSFDGYGTVFKITTKGVLTTLHSFHGFGSGQGDGPNSLILASDGNFYGTTVFGGTSTSCGGIGLHFGCGTAFKIAPNGTLTTILSFYHSTSTGGGRPKGGLLEGTDGNFYGTTSIGGPGIFGTVFQITTNGTWTTLIAFNYSNGSHPNTSLVQGRDGNLYGTTSEGGLGGGGVIFRVVQIPVIIATTPFNGNVTLTWTSFTSGVYRVEYKPSLAVTNWTTLVPKVTATCNTVDLIDTAGGATERYYRVVLLP